MNVLIKKAAELESCQTLDALWGGAVDVFSSLGLDHAVYLSVDSSFENLFVQSTMPDLYKETPPSEDPFLIHSCNRYEILPVGTEFIAEHPYISDSERAFIERAAEQGLCSGFGLPMRLKGAERFGGFVLGNALGRDEFLNRMMPRAEDIRMFCMIIHRRIEELIAPAPELETPRERSPLAHNALPLTFDVLTPRETEVPMLLAQGQTRKATAHICGLSVHTVSDYAKIAYRKLGVRNRAVAAALLYAETNAMAGRILTPKGLDLSAAHPYLLSTSGDTYHEQTTSYPLSGCPARFLRRRRPCDQNRRDGDREMGRACLCPPRDRA